MSADPGAITLRDVEDTDLPLFFSMATDPVAIRMAAFTHEHPDDHGAFLAHWTRLRADPTVMVKTILHEGEVVGNIASWVQEDETELTYWIARSHWGRGIATQALREFLKLQGARPIFAGAAADNGGSLRVLERCGFETIGKMRGYAHGRKAEIPEVRLRLG